VKSCSANTTSNVFWSGMLYPVLKNEISCKKIHLSTIKN
jgi:hypothetical protein